MDKTKHLEPELVLLTESIYDTPDPFRALTDPEGLSAIGGDLKPERLIHLYQRGFFPWFSEADPILWWHPLERCTLVPSEFHCSRSLKKALRKNAWSYQINANFQRTIQLCSELRAQKEGTWITEDIIQAYSGLNKLEYGFSIEVFCDGELAGGFYGVAMGKFFFGESMFSLKENGSKVALMQFCILCESLGIEQIDCQVESDHILSLGAQMRTKECFVADLKQLIPEPSKNQKLIALAQHEAPIKIVI